MATRNALMKKNLIATLCAATYALSMYVFFMRVEVAGGPPNADLMAVWLDFWQIKRGEYLPSFIGFIRLVLIYLGSIGVFNLSKNGFFNSEKP
jgi:hypothetical protein